MVKLSTVRWRVLVTAAARETTLASQCSVVVDWKIATCSFQCLDESWQLFFRGSPFAAVLIFPPCHGSKWSRVWPTSSWWILASLANHLKPSHYRLSSRIEEGRSLLHHPFQFEKQTKSFSIQFHFCRWRGGDGKNPPPYIAGAELPGQQP